MDSSVADETLIAKCYYSELRVSLKSSNFLNTRASEGPLHEVSFLGVLNSMRILCSASLVYFTVPFLAVLQVFGQPPCSRCNVTASPTWPHRHRPYQPACPPRQQQTPHTHSTRTSSTQFNFVHKVKSDTQKETWDVAAFRLVISYVVFEWEIFCIMLVYY